MYIGFLSKEREKEIISWFDGYGKLVRKTQAIQDRIPKLFLQFGRARIVLNFTDKDVPTIHFLKFQYDGFDGSQLDKTFYCSLDEDKAKQEIARLLEIKNHLDKCPLLNDEALIEELRKGE